MVKRSDFPKEFIWGTATSAYQIEGASDIDGKTPSIWDTFCHNPQNIKDGTNGRDGCSHYNLYKQDIRLIKNLGAKNYRFSVSWPRLYSSGAETLNFKGLDFYNRLIDELLQNDITPWLTLYHWDLPQPLQDRGGWENPDMVSWFREYALKTQNHFKDRIKNWFVFNEPSVVSALGYGMGIHAPGIKSEKSYVKAAHNINMAIAETCRDMKEQAKNHNIGCSFATPYIRSLPGHETAVEIFDAIWNRNHLDPLLTGVYPLCTRSYFEEISDPSGWERMKTPFDFIGLQYYSPIFVKHAAAPAANMWGTFFGDTPDTYRKTGLGWAVAPEDLEAFIDDFLRRYGRNYNLLVSENGSAWNDTLDSGRIHDKDRIDYLERHLALLARRYPSVIKGYFVWSLLDNFEWAEGFKPRFGLVYVDYADNFRRIPKDSYDWYKNFLES